MTFLSAWFTVLVVSLLAVVTPGPDFALTLRNSLAYSRRAGVYTAVGVGLGNLVHATYSLVGVGLIVSQSIVLFSMVKGAGAVYLIYIGCKSLRAKRTSSTATHLQPRCDISRWRAFCIGFLGNLLNPKATLFFLALFTQILQPSTPLVAQIVYGSTVAFLAAAWFTVVALAVSHPAFKQRIMAWSHWLERLTGAVLIALGLRLAIAENR